MTDQVSTLQSAATLSSKREGLPQGISIPESERWVHEPEFKKRLEWADSWMQDYIPRYPYREGDKWVVLHKNFQVEMSNQSESSQAAILKIIKKVLAADWATILQDADLDCKELESLPGYLKLRLTDKHQVVVGSDGKRAMFLTLHSEEVPEVFVVDPEIWNEVTSYDLQHNHEIPPEFGVVAWNGWKETCPRCRASAREQADLFRLAMPLYVEALSSNDFYKAQENDETFWFNYIGSHIVAAQRMVAKRCGVFIPLQCHEKPDKEVAQYLSDWKKAHPGEMPDRSAD